MQTDSFKKAQGTEGTVQLIRLQIKTKVLR